MHRHSDAFIERMSERAYVDRGNTMFDAISVTIAVRLARGI
jgi:hypothetical protein